MKFKTKIAHFNEKLATSLLNIVASIYFFYVCTIAIVIIRIIIGYSDDWLLDVANDLQLEFLSLTLFAAARSEKSQRRKMEKIDSEVRTILKGGRQYE
jgi:low affinity Fe/Cu permease